jgi:PTS system cellobiose-specific IIC component
MKKIMDWLMNSFSPKMNKIVSNPWVAGVSSSMFKSIPFILTGSVVFFYNVFRYYFKWLPNLDPIKDYSFGLLALFVAFIVTYQLMEKLGHSRYQVTAGLVTVGVFIMMCLPKTLENGNVSINFGLFGPTGFLIAIIIGLYVSFIFNLYTKLNILKDNITLPDFVSEWINSIIPIFLTLAITMVLVFNFKIDIYNAIQSLFSPLINYGQTLPGFILLCLIPALFYSIGISSWFLYPLQMVVFLAGIDANIKAVAAGGIATNIVTSESVFTAALITMGGMGATLPLNILMLRSKSKKLSVLSKITLGPSLFNINEPILFGAPIVFNPLLMVPFWVNSITGPIVLWLSMKGGLLNIPSKMIQVGQIPAPFSSVMITEDIRAVIWYIVLFAIYALTWYPFYKVYEKQCVLEEQKVVVEQGGLAQQQ